MSGKGENQKVVNPSVPHLREMCIDEIKTHAKFEPHYYISEMDTLAYYDGQIGHYVLDHGDQYLTALIVKYLITEHYIGLVAHDFVPNTDK